MSVGGGGGESKTVVKPVTPKNLQDYFLTLDNLTITPPAPVSGGGGGGGFLGGSLGGNKKGAAGVPTQQGGRLLEFAREGTQGVDYSGLTEAQIRALGGLGATRLADLDAMRRTRAEELRADPALTLAQRTRAQQLFDTDLGSRRDAILQEVEGQLTDVAQEEARRRYEAALARSKIPREDLLALADIFFGGMGQTQKTSQSGPGTSVSDLVGTAYLISQI